MNPKFIIVTVFTNLLFSGLAGQTYSSLVSDSEILDFLNWHLKSEKRYFEEPKNRMKRLSVRIAKWDNGKLKYYLSYSNKDLWIREAFSAADTSFVSKQISSQTDTFWRNPVNGAKLMQPKKKRRPNYHFCSLPLFSVDRNFVIIYSGYKCGSLCAYGSYKVYKK